MHPTKIFRRKRTPIVEKAPVASPDSPYIHLVESTPDNLGSYEKFKLKALLESGIDPSSMEIDTGLTANAPYADIDDIDESTYGDSIPPISGNDEPELIKTSESITNEE